MNLDPRKLNIALIVIYLACMIFTIYTLFQLQHDLVYSSGALSLTDVQKGQPVFTKLYIIAGITLLAGLGALVHIFGNREAEVVYIEKKKEDERKKQKEKDEQDQVKETFETAFIDDIIKKEKEDSKVLEKSLTGICKKLEAGSGVFYKLEKQELTMQAAYALNIGDSKKLKFELGEGLVGQAGKERAPLIIDDIPEDYIKIVSGLGSSSPTHLLILPIEKGNKLLGVIEIASFTAFSESQIDFVKIAIKKALNKPTAEPQPATEKTKKAATKESTKEKSKKA